MCPQDGCAARGQAVSRGHVTLGSHTGFAPSLANSRAGARLGSSDPRSSALSTTTHTPVFGFAGTSVVMASDLGLAGSPGCHLGGLHLKACARDRERADTTT